MKKVFTGKGYISVLTLLAIWSLSLVVDLPGLAISPIISVIDKVFPGSTHLECQMLEILPNFCIFPFILLSGKLANSKYKVPLVVVGLSVFLVSGIAYFFSRSILWLIIVSCVLGMGCGLVIPLAAGLLAETFVGKYRLQQMGIKSGIANFTLVFATLIVGLVEGKDWHLPFLVYLVAVIPLLMSVFLTKGFLRHNGASIPGVTGPETERSRALEKGLPDPGPEAENVIELPHAPVKTGMKTAPAAVREASSDPKITSLDRSTAVRKIWGIIFFYLVVTITGITVSFFIPFLMQSHHMGDAATGYVSAVFYFAVTAPGFLLGKVVCTLRRFTIPVTIISMIGGLVMIPLIPHLWAYFVGSILVGFGYGALQPIFYDKAAVLAPAANSTRMLSYIMAANYLGVAVCPLVLAGLSSSLAFIVSAVVMAVVLILSIVFRNWFIFNISNELRAYEHPVADPAKTSTDSTSNNA